MSQAERAIDSRVGLITSDPEVAFVEVFPIHESPEQNPFLFAQSLAAEPNWFDRSVPQRLAERGKRSVVLALPPLSDLPIETDPAVELLKTACRQRQLDQPIGVFSGDTVEQLAFPALDAGLLSGVVLVEPAFLPTGRISWDIPGLIIEGDDPSAANTPVEVARNFNQVSIATPNVPLQEALTSPSGTELLAAYAAHVTGRKPLAAEVGRFGIYKFVVW